ncbi:uncharacterized protein LOC129610756 isoform X2 [Condylostylus longicornis]|uniref:uncharacterized protein LOC129610756 isoform X2 n=1 Tax=Condylostylus longicornis TaxID=2530218 RepID=UPI00244E3530|nr:uncharacterized protein LOC129610756 isoform X2 [Condylostylus longicornis]
MQQNVIKKDIESRFRVFQIIARWAGIIGVIQSVIWIGFAITGILYYMCVLQYEKGLIVNFGNIIGLTIHRLYFYSSECSNFPNIDFKTELNLTPSQINIWIWVYLAVSVFWFFSSLSLITLSLITPDIDIKHLKRTNSLLFIWIFIVLSLSLMDLGLGIIFGLDFNIFHSKTSALQFPKDPGNNTTGIIFLTQEIAALSMMFVALRGFILWIVNIAMILVLYKETFIIKKAQQIKPVEEENLSIAHSIHTRPAVRAYDTRNEAVVAVRSIENRAPSPISSLDAAAIERASKLSNAVLMSRKSRFANYEQYPPDNSHLNNQHSPAPDYSTQTQNIDNPFVRRQNTNSFLKNQRYQSYLYNNNNQ